MTEGWAATEWGSNHPFPESPSSPLLPPSQVVALPRTYGHSEVPTAWPRPALHPAPHPCANLPSPRGSPNLLPPRPATPCPAYAGWAGS